MKPRNLRTYGQPAAHPAVRRGMRFDSAGECGSSNEGSRLFPAVTRFIIDRTPFPYSGPDPHWVGSLLAIRGRVRYSAPIAACPGLAFQSRVRWAAFSETLAWGWSSCSSFGSVWFSRSSSLSADASKTIRNAGWQVPSPVGRLPVQQVAMSPRGRSSAARRVSSAAISTCRAAGTDARRFGGSDHAFTATGTARPGGLFCAAARL